MLPETGFGQLKSYQSIIFKDRFAIDIIEIFSCYEKRIARDISICLKK